jgi:hypothetical protein
MIYFQVLPTDQRWLSLNDLQKEVLSEALVRLPDRATLFGFYSERKQNEKLIIKGEAAEVLNTLGFPVDEINKELMGEETTMTNDQIRDSSGFLDNIQRQRQEIYEQNRKDYKEKGVDKLNFLKLAEYFDKGE